MPRLGGGALDDRARHGRLRPIDAPAAPADDRRRLRRPAGGAPGRAWSWTGLTWPACPGAARWCSAWRPAPGARAPAGAPRLRQRRPRPATPHQQPAGPGGGDSLPGPVARRAVRRFLARTSADPDLPVEALVRAYVEPLRRPGTLAAMRRFVRDTAATQPIDLGAISRPDAGGRAAGRPDRAAGHAGGDRCPHPERASTSRSPAAGMRSSSRRPTAWSR